MPCGVIEHKKTQSRIRVSIEQGVNFCITAIDADDGVPSLYVDLSNKSFSLHLKDIFCTIASVKYSKRKTTVQKIRSF